MDDFSSADDDDDLLEVLDRYECRKRVTAATLPEISDEISHKELVQKPKLVIDCCREITQTQIHLSSGELTKMYSDLTPHPKESSRNIKLSFKDDIQAGRAPEKIRQGNLMKKTLGDF